MICGYWLCALQAAFAACGYFPAGLITASVSGPGFPAPVGEARRNQSRHRQQERKAFRRAAPLSLHRWQSCGKDQSLSAPSKMHRRLHGWLRAFPVCRRRVRFAATFCSPWHGSRRERDVTLSVANARDDQSAIIEFVLFRTERRVNTLKKVQFDPNRTASTGKLGADRLPALAFEGVGAGLAAL